MLRYLSLVDLLSHRALALQDDQADIGSLGSIDTGTTTKCIPPTKTAKLYTLKNEQIDGTPALSVVVEKPNPYNRETIEGLKPALRAGAAEFIVSIIDIILSPPLTGTLSRLAMRAN